VLNVTIVAEAKVTAPPSSPVLRLRRPSCVELVIVGAVQNLTPLPRRRGENNSSSGGEFKAISFVL